MAAGIGKAPWFAGHGKPLKSAVEDGMKLLKAHPEDPELLLALARLLRADNQLSQARRYLMAAGKSLQTGASLNDKADELRQLIAGELGQLVLQHVDAETKLSPH